MLEEDAILGPELNIDVSVEIHKGGMTEQEIGIKEEKYIENSIEEYGVLPSTEADVRRMLILAGKGEGELFEEEHKELRKLTREIAQRRLEEIPKLVLKCLIAAYRTTGLVHTMDKMTRKVEKFRDIIQSHYLEEREAQNSANSCEF